MYVIDEFPIDGSEGKITIYRSKEGLEWPFELELPGLILMNERELNDLIRVLQRAKRIYKTSNMDA